MPNPKGELSEDEASIVWDLIQKLRVATVPPLPRFGDFGILVQWPEDDVACAVMVTDGVATVYWQAGETGFSYVDDVGLGALLESWAVRCREQVA